MSLAVSSFFPWSLPDPLECSGTPCAVLDLDLEVLEFPLRLTLGVGSLVGSRGFSRGTLASLLSLYSMNLLRSSGDNFDRASRKIS